MPYQTAGNLRLKFDGHDDFTAFYRDLDIERAVATTTYKVGEVSYKREVFSSFSDGVIVIRLTADKPGSIAFKMSMDRPGDVTVKAEADNLLSMSGFTSGFEGVKGDTLAFVVLAKVINEGGELSSDEASVSLANSNSATILVSIGTGFVNYKDISGDAYAQAMEYLGKAEGRDFRAMQKDHTAFYQNLFNRVTLDLGRTDSVKNTTDVRIEQFRYGNDPSLAALYFQYGRYLLISSSQPGTQAANLQGIWTDQLFPAWDSKYTININAEMNYWPAEPTNLSELHEPLIQMIRELAEAGSVTAKTMYGAGGWVAHHNTDIWRITGPVDGAYWGMWPMGGVWLSQHLFDKYEFSGDTEYLRSVYPVMKGAAEFCLDVLQEHPETGWLVIVPSNSPENSPADHYQSSMSAGTTMDNQLVADIMQKTLKAAEILGIDEPLKERMETALAKLPPMQIGKHGQLQEWMYDWDNPNDKHRQVN
jgi:alpha-L-fucosidase 2